MQFYVIPCILQSCSIQTKGQNSHKKKTLSVINQFILVTRPTILPSNQLIKKASAATIGILYNATQNVTIITYLDFIYCVVAIQISQFCIFVHLHEKLTAPCNLIHA